MLIQRWIDVSPLSAISTRRRILGSAEDPHQRREMSAHWELRGEQTAAAIMDSPYDGRELDPMPSMSKSDVAPEGAGLP